MKIVGASVFALFLGLTPVLAGSDGSQKSHGGGKAAARSSGKSSRHTKARKAPKVPHEKARSAGPRSTAVTHVSHTRCENCDRDAHGRIVRSRDARKAFKKATGFPHGRPGYVIDHIVPLACHGTDLPSNMQWQTKDQAKAKDKTERAGCGR